ncbi:hypothetical protein AGDE_14898 [Angomonas deanei]|nr:hypothetical protein AGDE_14898 [Angomonas deanei]|eukprot:EPY20029.1 hypothetical protein AGDE_14898 [Angomonas deanei]
MGSLRAAEVSEMLRLQRDYRREHSKRLSLQQRTAELEQEEELLMEKEFRMRLKSLELQQQKEMNQLQQVFEAFENSANNSL